MRDAARIWLDCGYDRARLFDDAGQSWEEIPERDQQIVALWKFGVDVQNEGLAAFASRHGDPVFAIVLRALESIGAHRALALATEGRAIVARGDQDERLPQIDEQLRAALHDLPALAVARYDLT